MGARTLHLPDWPFGAAGRRWLLNALLRREQPVDGWRKTELEARMGVANGALAPHLPGAVDLGLAVVRDGRVQRADDSGDLADILRALLERVDALPDRAPRPLTHRHYQRHADPPRRPSVRP
jgi:hypothetical protein